MERIIKELDRRISDLYGIINKTEADKEKISYLVSTQNSMIIVNGLMNKAEDNK